MPTSSPASSALAGARSTADTPEATRGRPRRRGLWVTTAIALVSLGLFADLLLVGHTDQRQRPPLGPLDFTGMGIAGALSLRAGTKGN